MPMTTYRKKPLSVSHYTAMRGAIDFSNPEQFNLYESGYQFLTVVSRPRYIEMLAENDPEVQASLDLFCWILEYEFKGLSGIDNISIDPLEFTDNISTINTIGKINMQSTIEITMTFNERSGSAMTGFIEYYLKGLKDPRTQMKTYHGLIKEGKLAAGFENEIFHLLYIVTDNTGLGLEKAFLFACAQPTTAQLDIYNGEKGTIEAKTIDVSFQAFLIDGDEVDKRAIKMLAYISEDYAVSNAAKVNGHSGNARGAADTITVFADEQVHPDSNNLNYKAFDEIDEYYH